MGFSPTLPIVVFEPGHANTKGQATNLDISDPIVHFQSLIAEVSETRYNTLADRALSQGNRAFHLVKWDGRYFVVGATAEKESGYIKPRKRTARWVKDYVGILMCALLQQLYFGDVPKEITMYAAHPPKDFEHRKKLLDCLKGVWAWETPGCRKITTRVTFVAPYDELVGSIMNLLLDEQGRQTAKPHPVFSGTTVVVDFGGGTLDLTRVVNGNIDYDRTESENIGGNQALLRFKQAIEQHKDIRAILDGTEFPMEEIYPIAMHPDKRFDDAGVTYYFKDEFNEAFAPLVNQAGQFIEEFFGRLVGVNYILIAGGIGGLIYDMIAPKLFSRWYSDDPKKNRVIRADAVRDMMIANAKGARKMALATRSAIMEDVQKHAR